MTDEPLFADETPAEEPVAPANDWTADLTPEENTFLADAGLTGDSCITITTSTAGTSYVPTAEAMTASDAFKAARLNPAFDAQLFLEGAQIGWDQVLQPGQTVVVIGSVKGG